MRKRLRFLLHSRLNFRLRLREPIGFRGLVLQISLHLELADFEIRIVRFPDRVNDTVARTADAAGLPFRGFPHLVPGAARLRFGKSIRCPEFPVTEENALESVAEILGFGMDLANGNRRDLVALLDDRHFERRQARSVRDGSGMTRSPQFIGRKLRTRAIEAVFLLVDVSSTDGFVEFRIMRAFFITRDDIGTHGRTGFVVFERDPVILKRRIQIALLGYFGFGKAVFDLGRRNGGGLVSVEQVFGGETGAGQTDRGGDDTRGEQQRRRLPGDLHQPAAAFVRTRNLRIRRRPDFAGDFFERPFRHGILLFLSAYPEVPASQRVSIPESGKHMQNDVFQERWLPRRNHAGTHSIAKTQDFLFDFFGRCGGRPSHDFALPASRVRERLQERAELDAVRRNSRRGRNDVPVEFRRGSLPVAVSGDGGVQSIREIRKASPQFGQFRVPCARSLFAHGGDIDVLADTETRVDPFQKSDVVRTVFVAPALLIR
ncbi:MAG: hypothetical protein ING19_20685, partial [Azospirillum sp.]|nr:hypothetical protein [Azospirillum sp.]